MNRIQIQQIKNDIKEGYYSLEKITVDEKELSRKKRIKRIEKKIQKKYLTKEKMMFLFELEKELDDEYTYEGDKNVKVQVRQIYKSFKKLYPRMPYNKSWKLKHFKDMSVKDIEEIARNWILTELNPIEEENMW